MGSVHQPHAATAGTVQKPRQTVGDAEFLVPRVGGEDRLAQLPALDHVPGADRRAEVALTVADQQVHTRALDGVENPVALLDRVGHRLLEEDVLSRGRGVDGGALVEEVRQRDHDGVDIVALEHLVRAGIRPAAVRFGERIGALAVGVEHGDQTHAVGVRDGSSVSVPRSPCAEDGNTTLAHIRYECSRARRAGSDLRPAPSVRRSTSTASALKTLMPASSVPSLIGHTIDSSPAARSAQLRRPCSRMMPSYASCASGSSDPVGIWSSASKVPAGGPAGAPTSVAGPRAARIAVSSASAVTVVASCSNAPLSGSIAWSTRASRLPAASSAASGRNVTTSGGLKLVTLAPL